MENILHRIKAYLYKNVFMKDRDDYSARIISERSLNVKDICESAVTRGGANISASAMHHAVELFLKEMEYKLCDGFSVNTGSFTAFPSLKGIFNSPTEPFNPDKHKLLFRFRQGESLRKKLSSIEVQIMGTADSAVCIDQITDLKSGCINGQITPLHNLRVNGRKLKLTGNHPEVGVYFINQETGIRTKIMQSDIIINYPTEIVIMIPALAPGAYLLEIVNQYTTAGTLRQPHIAMFERELIVKE